MADSKPKKASQLILPGELRELLSKLRIPQISRQLWNEVLTAAERKKLGDEFPRDHITEGIARLRKCSLERAIIDLAESTDLISAARHRLLSRQFNEGGGTPSVSGAQRLEMRWESSTGRLFLNEVQVGKFRVLETPSAIQQVLDAFDAANWTSPIQNTLYRKLGQGETHRLICRLNKGVKRIRFAAQMSARELTWAAL